MSAIGSIRNGGRYNAKAAFEVLYTAESAETVLRETRMVVQQPDGTWATVPTAPRVFVTIEYDVTCFVDLTDGTTLADLRIDAADLVCDWELDVLRGRVPPTHAIGAAARGAGVEALRVPSKRHVGTTNIIVIVDQLLRTSRASILDPKGFAAGTVTKIVGHKATRFDTRTY